MLPHLHHPNCMVAERQLVCWTITTTNSRQLQLLLPPQPATSQSPKSAFVSLTTLQHISLTLLFSKATTTVCMCYYCMCSIPAWIFSFPGSKNLIAVLAFTQNDSTMFIQDSSTICPLFHLLSSQEFSVLSQPQNLIYYTQSTKCSISA